MSDAPFIRQATTADAAALLDIYRPYVENTAVSFELVAPTVDEFAARIAKALSRWEWLVAEHDGKCIAYAYGSSHREREAYAWCGEVSAYVHPAHRGRRVAQHLYNALFDKLQARGYCNAYAGIALPNEASIALHRSVGFTPIGVFKSAGRKFGAWHDIAWFGRVLRNEPLSQQRP